MQVLDQLGIGLWTMQSTATAPIHPSVAYRAFAEDAAVVEKHGLHSVWTAEHRSWYDGWCPALLHAQAYALARTSRVRFGNAMLLLPQHDASTLARSVTTLQRLSGGRIELGVGLGHRDAEYDTLGLRRDQRGRTMDASLATLHSAWSGHDARPGDAPRIWIGGMAPAAIARAARLGHSLMLPQTVSPQELAAIAASYRAQLTAPATIGVMRDVWIEPDARRAEEFSERLLRHYREEAGAWWVLKGEVGFRQPDQLERQLDRVASSALIGDVSHVARGLNKLLAAGAEFLVLRLQFDMVPQAQLHQQIARLAQQVAPLLQSPAQDRTETDMGPALPTSGAR